MSDFKATAIRRAGARGGLEMPALGLGTWTMGEKPARRRDEVAALKLGLDLGMTLIDTAEMYAEGGAERVVADALEGRRDEVFLVSKVLPQNASRRGTVKACEASLKRLGTDRIDLYLLHWQGTHPLEETLEAFDELERGQKIRFWGVSNFDLGAMREADKLPLGRRIAANQVLYNLDQRSVDFALLDWCAERGIAVMAYSPLHRGKLKRSQALKSVAKRHGVAPETAALAWTLRFPALISIPKAGSPEHLRANRQAIDLELSAEDLALLDKAYPPPTAETGIDMP